MERLLEIMRRLRAPDGCPWDQKQTHESLRPYLLEEAAEAVDAIGSGSAEKMADELGDVLLQIAFHAVIAEESGTFRYEDIEGAIVAKLIRRHPHVFGSTTVSGADEVVANWQEIKAAERRERGESRTRVPGDEVPRSLPGLSRAARLGKALGWEAPATLEAPSGSSDEIGDHLLEVALLARENGVDPEIALRDALERRLESGSRE